MPDATATIRRDADSAASIGRTTSQIAAKLAIPPVKIATIITRPATAIEDMICALS